MDRFWRGGLAAVSAIVAISGVALVLLGEGLDRAEKWVSIAGVLLSVVFGGAGAVFGFLHWRRSEIAKEVPTSAAGEGADTSAVASSAGPVPSPDLRHAQGVQVGDGNIQENRFF
ncbi:RIP homotypic interaction motif-containing protein [Micromonospora pallida]|nr:RIP homotypic interaction motif-containing protein [Micromonospora pallida]